VGFLAPFKALPEAEYLMKSPPLSTPLT
jgi:hypothetical protein